MLSMPTRRHVTTGLAALAVIVLAGMPAAQAQGAPQAEAFVKQFADELVAIVNGPQGSAAKQQALGPVIDRNVDVDAIARFCLGRFWNQATPSQQQTYTALFHHVLLNNISGHLGEYRGVSYTMTGSKPQGDSELVSTVITRPNAPPANVQWVVSASTGQPKVVDVVAEGTSLRLTQRQDYASYLNRHGGSIDALNAALGRQLNGS
jgi:phospholipid transport system substrate-binding protein